MRFQKALLAGALAVGAIIPVLGTEHANASGFVCAYANVSVCTSVTSSHTVYGYVASNPDFFNDVTIALYQCDSTGGNCSQIAHNSDQTGAVHQMFGAPPNGTLTAATGHTYKALASWHDVTRGGGSAGTWSPANACGC
jgi:hypothetical protein